MIEVPEEDLLFTGDNANNGRIVRMDDGNFKGNMAALDRALELGVSTYVPGHGRSGGRELVEAYRTYLQDMYS